MQNNREHYALAITVVVDFSCKSNSKLAICILRQVTVDTLSISLHQ